MMRDKVIQADGATLQHGSLSERVYIMHLGQAEPGAVLQTANQLARDNDYTKIFAKIPEEAEAPFTQDGFVREARVPDMYGPGRAAVFLGKFLSPGRGQVKDPEELARVRRISRAKTGLGPGPRPPGFIFRELAPPDCPAMAELYARTFASYPFPITDPEYLLATMRSHVLYAGAWHGSRLAALASAEMDREAGNVELTDFATDPEFRGKRLSGHLLRFLPPALASRYPPGFSTGYTIARAISYGMNITFARAGFSLAGTLVNNTQIAGGLESMNVWYRKLDADAKMNFAPACSHPHL